jgi:adenosine deaminase/adenosine deaminase CECR1
VKNQSKKNSSMTFRINHYEHQSMNIHCQSFFKSWLHKSRLFFLTVFWALVLPSLALGQNSRVSPSDYAVTQSYYNSLLGKGSSSLPRLAQLNVFSNMMPKGGDIHHHYSGALYAETYLDWVGKEGLCVDRASYKIVIKTPLPVGMDCLTSEKVRADDAFYRQLLMRWSDKDYGNHFHDSLAPDQQFFKTFEYFGTISKAYHKEGLLLLKQRAIQEKVQYIETMFYRAPGVQAATLDPAFDLLSTGTGDPALSAALTRAWTVLESDSGLQKKITDYVHTIDEATEGLDDPDFLLRTQAYVMRDDRPSAVFSSMYSAFKSVEKTDKLVGVNIVGPENNFIAMRDYGLHMQMFRFLKEKFPASNLSLHAGELALGMVPPEGLRDHIREAVEIAGAKRIGHGLDIAYETGAVQLLREMSQKKVVVEINLSSNALIAGIQGLDHPITVYMEHGVPIVISTDDEGVSRSSISHEYLLFMSRYQPSYASLKDTVYNSIRYSFMRKAEQVQQLRQLDARFTQFEKETAAMVRGLARQAH